jgi:hypothetical protein
VDPDGFWGKKNARRLKSRRAGFFWLIQVSQMARVTAQFSFGNLR